MRPGGLHTVLLHGRRRTAVVYPARTGCGLFDAFVLRAFEHLGSSSFNMADETVPRRAGGRALCEAALVLRPLPHVPSKTSGAAPRRVSGRCLTSGLHLVAPGWAVNLSPDS